MQCDRRDALDEFPDPILGVPAGSWMTVAFLMTTMGLIMEPLLILIMISLN